MANMAITMADINKLDRSVNQVAVERTKQRDIESSQVAAAVYWTCDDVANFIELLGFPQYKECFLRNKVDGRRLIWCDASHLNLLGINEFKHIIFIAKSIRELLQTETPYWNRSISLPYCEALGRYLEQRSVVGRKSDELDFATYSFDTKNAKFEPVLTNQGVL
ncbi:unnamed protein product [Didymodactylos carnosus]|uniref:SAM domain-containing protein n=1 Tax=Didymodactylos carnosus TaxID=1234261 RepID=A0A814EQ94_9BILA|nr:unnamed protein product [Didymodactylos carnosus]CAF3748181.1 unnamed protein product [Didymodactylos carnosus]